jgi:hypothetical protein
LSLLGGEKNVNRNVAGNLYFELHSLYTVLSRARENVIIWDSDDENRAKFEGKLV